MVLVVFLGNPGKEYEKTRHNYGWMAADFLSQNWSWTSKFKALVATVQEGGGKYLTLKPQTFMNLSGESAQACCAFHKIPPEQVLVVHDDLELPLGEYKVQKSGGLGGHNGLRSLEKHLGSRDFWRIRLGIGRPVKGDVGSFVLNRFTPEEEITRDQVLERLRREWPDLLLKLQA